MSNKRTVNSFVSILILISLAFTNYSPSYASNSAYSAKDAPISGNQSQPDVTSPAFVPGVVLVGFKPGVTIQQNPITKGRPRTFNTNSATLGTTLRGVKAQSIKRLFPEAKRPGPKRGADMLQTHRLRLPANANVLAAVQALSADSSVAFAEPDYIALPADVALTDNLLTIDDPLYGQQWGLAKIDIESAWSSTYGSSTVAIAIVDSGIDLTHVDLADNLWVNPGEIAGNGLDDDNNGHIDDINGWNFVSDNNDISDDNGHGTLVTGVAAAIGGNTQGIVGACPECSIMPVKVMQASGTANYSDVAAGVLYAAQKGAKVINISLGGYANSNILRNAIETAVNTYGAVVVAGAGNDNAANLFYPAAYEEVLAVAGTNSYDTKAVVSNYGSWVDVSAPAIDIDTTASGGGWAQSSGTSLASPFAAGLAGLLRSLNPTWSQALVRSQIIHTTDNIDALNPAYTSLLGSGRLNAGSALTIAPHPVLELTAYSVNGEVSGKPLLGATAQLTVTLHNDGWDALGVTSSLSTTDAYTTIINGSAGYGDIAAGTSKTNATAFSFSVASGAGYNHAIPFTLAVSDTTGYSNSLNFTVTTESGVENKSGTLTTQTWTNDKTYLITGNISIPTGNTLTIQPGTTIKFNGNYTLSVRGTLIADGTESQLIRFKSNTAGTWDKIFFDDLNIDAQADGSGNYTSGSILRYATIEGSTAGITCTTATPYLAHIDLKSSGIGCSIGSTPLWLLDSTITESSILNGGTVNAYRNVFSNTLSISGEGNLQNNVINGDLSLGSGTVLGNTINSEMTVGGSWGHIDGNTVRGNISVGDAFTIANNTILGSINTGNAVTIDHNTVSNGITVGSMSTVTWNNVENASGTALSATNSVTARYNRLVGNAAGMSANSGLIEHNLIANNTGIGLQVGAATVRYNTITGNKGNSIIIQGGNPLAFEYNNLEGNSGAYDFYINIAAGATVSVGNNWWGTMDSDVIINRIYDWNDDDLKGTASFTPMLNGPDQTAPGYVRSVTIDPDPVGIETATFEVEFSKSMDTNNSPSMQFYNSLKGTWSQYTTYNSGLLANNISPIAIESNGKKWFGTNNGYPNYGVASLDGTNWMSYQLNDGIYSITIEADGTKWFGMANSGVLSFDGISWNAYNTSNSELPSNNLHSIAIDASGKKWFGTSDGLASFDGTNWMVFNTSNSGLPNNYIYDIAIENNGTKWFATWGGGVASFDGTHWKVFNSSNSGLPSDGVFSIAIEDNGTKWFGTTDRGAASFDGTNWVAYNESNSALSSSVGVQTIEIDADGTKWFCGMGAFGGVKSFDGNLWTTYNTSNSGLPSYIWSMAIDNDGNKWLGTTFDGVIVLYGGKNNRIVENQHWFSPDLYQATYDITSAISKATYRVNVSDVLDPDGMRVAPFLNTTFVVDYAGAITDKTPPIKPVVSSSGDGGLTTLSASWSSSDPQSPITQYRYAIGTTPGGRDVVDWTYTNDTFVTRNNLSLTFGLSYYVSVGARNEGGLWSLSGVSNAVKAGLPEVVSIVRASANPSAATSVNFTVTFNESVSSVDAADFGLASTGVTGAAVTSVSGGPALYTVAVNTGSGNGTIGLNLIDNDTILDAASNPLGGVGAGNGNFTTGQVYTINKTLTFNSTGTQDGWILESTETSGVGGTLNSAAATFNLGDDKLKKQYRAMMSFSTGAGLPDNAVITAVTLKIKKSGVVGGGNPMTAFQGFMVDIKKGPFGTAALQAGDFQATASKSYGPFKPALVSNWYSINLTSAKAYINKLSSASGLTQIRLRFKLDDNNNAVANYLSLFSGNALATSRPQLIITYYVP